MEVGSSPIPIFVIGKHRSGTTGLANHICQHTNIAGVQHREHWGIHESGYFTYLAGRYGSLESWPNFREFVEIFTASDYFTLTDLNKNFVLSLFPTSYSDFFKSVMDEFARQHSAPLWLEKSPTHTKKALWLAKKYPTARFVAIIRDVEDVVASVLAKADMNLQSKYKLTVASRVVYAWVYYNKTISELSKKYSSRSITVHFGEFCNDKECVLRRITSFLGVDYQPDMVTKAYKPNTSFSGKQTRNRLLSEREKAFIRQLASMLNTIPYEAYWALDTLRNYIWKKEPELPKWFFRLSDQKLNTEKNN